MGVGVSAHKANGFRTIAPEAASKAAEIIVVEFRKRVAREGRRPDALVYFTDGEGEFPIHAPDYPVFWLIKGQAPIPWGRRVSLTG